MTPALLREVGEALDGPSWQTALAARLGVTVRTVQRWASGERGIPDGLAGELVPHLETKVGTVGKLAVQLRRMKSA